MYAQLCKRLSEEAKNFENLHKQDGKDQRGRGGGGGGDQFISELGGRRVTDSSFTRMLLNKCRIEFENRSKANEAFENQLELSPEDEERRHTAKRKMLGNIKFIGELGKLEIVSNSILHKCIQQLLDKKRGGSRGDPAEDIECLCQIMRTCGRILDTNQGAQLMEQYFNRMNSLAKSGELPLRIRFMLRDVIELRKDGWVPRKATSAEGPMPINQLRTDGDEQQHHHRGLGPAGVLQLGPGQQGGGYFGRLPGSRGIDPSGRSSLENDMFRHIGRVSLDPVDNLGMIPLSSPGFPIGGPGGFAGSNGFGPGSGPYGSAAHRHNQRNQNNMNSPFYPGNQNRHQNNYQGKHNQQQHNMPQNYNSEYF